MATAAPNNSLPLFYEALEPLNLNQHGKMKLRRVDQNPAMGATHAVPATVDEFTLLQRHYPIIFSVGDNPLPLALMGLTEGINTFFDEAGRAIDTHIYVPAYMRRYPFMLARLREGSEDMSLCYDPTSDVVGEFEDGEPLFDGEQPSETTQSVLAFCEQFEAAGQRTTAFMADLAKSGLLMDGEVSIQPQGMDQPYVYRGFQMVDEAKLRELRGDELRKMSQSGMLPLIYAHLFSLSLLRDLFGRQVAQGKGPIPLSPPEPAEA
jgi:hypothetical protein